jgi:L-rhamnose mutarotase
MLNQMKIALHSVVKAGRARGYDDAHQTIPADLVESFERVGIHGWTIWRSGQELFHVVDCEDFTAAMSALAEDPANIRWQAYIGPFVDHFVTTADEPAEMVVPQVWDLASQRSASASDAVAGRRSTE